MDIFEFAHSCLDLIRISYKANGNKLLPITEIAKNEFNIKVGADD